LAFGFLSRSLSLFFEGVFSTLADCLRVCSGSTFASGLLFAFFLFFEFSDFSERDEEDSFADFDLFCFDFGFSSTFSSSTSSLVTFSSSLLGFGYRFYLFFFLAARH